VFLWLENLFIRSNARATHAALIIKTNVSAKDISRKLLASSVASTMEEHQLDPGQLRVN